MDFSKAEIDIIAKRKTPLLSLKSKPVPLIEFGFTQD
jgi:hypothetical protein